MIEEETGMAGHDMQGAFRWLDGRRESDLQAWLEFWRNTEARRPHDHPGYLRAMASPGCVPAAVFYRHSGGACVLYPFYWRSLVELPYIARSFGEAIHLVSPYGYGGPLYEGPEEMRPTVSEVFNALFRDEAARRGAVSEFIREDLFPERLVIRPGGERLEQQPNVVVRLGRDPEEIWRSYLPKVRKNVSAARRHGLQVVFDPAGEHLDGFLSVYRETMERTGAAASFFLERERFESMGRSLGADGGLVYVHVFEGDRIISTELLLLSSDTVYSFLGGTAAASFDKRPNDLLKHEAIQWGQRQGFRHYVLGGGITPGDGIFRYKRAFDPEGVVPFHVARIKHDQVRYDTLVEARARFESESGRSWQPREDYFPSYLS